MTGYKDIFHCYNESQLLQTFFDGPRVFLITEFESNKFYIFQNKII